MKTNKGLKITVTVVALLLIIAIPVSFMIIKEPKSVYADESYWAAFGDGKSDDKKADVFYIAPTVDMGKDGNFNMDINNEKLRSRFVGAINTERDVYQESAVLYAPYYRQMTFPVYDMSKEEMQPYFEIAYKDVCEAFEYYIKHVNNGRPYILAGFSQGAHLVIELIKDYMDLPLYQKGFVAAYAIGWRVTDEDVQQHKHLRVATCEDDTGVVISYNSEAVGVESSTMVPKGVKTYSINPLNWMTDSTLADKSLHLGACFIDYDGSITEEIPEFTSAYIDETRGTLIVDVDKEKYSSPLFEEGIYHLNDINFFFRNLQENVKVRIDTFVKNHNS